MKFTSLFNKLKFTFSKVLNNDIDLERKTFKSNFFKYNNLIKTPKILYDSDWLNIASLQGTLTSSNIFLSYAYSTAKKNQNTPFSLSYEFSNILNISENDLPFINSSILIKNYPNTTICGINEFQAWGYGDNYWKIYGDTVKLYEGISPSSRFFSEQDRIDGKFLVYNASKWFYGTIKFSKDSDNYELTNGYIVAVATYYDIVESSEYPGTYNYKYFSTQAIDAISDSSVIGEGTYTVTTINEFGIPISVTTKNVQMTAPLFEDRTTIVASGHLYKNDISQGYYSDLFPYSIEFVGILQPVGFILTDFSYEWNNQWKLFWDNKRARQFRFNESFRTCLLYTSPSPRDATLSRMPSSA